MSIVVALFTAIAFMVIDGGDLARAPDIVHSRFAHVPEPLWVSEEVALDENRELRLEYFSESSRSGFSRMLERNADGECHLMGLEPVALQIRSDSSLDDVIENASIIVAGTVVRTQRGFLNGIAGELLSLSGVERLKEIPPLPNGDVLYLFYPGGKIQTPRGAICFAAPRSSPPPPRVGDRLVAFMFGRPVDEAGGILQVDLRKHLLIQHRGTFIPNRLAQSIDHERSLEDILSVVRRHRGRHHVPPPMITH